MPNHDKTEKATPKRRQEARRKGQVAKSPDFNAAVVITVGLLGVALTTSKFVNATGNDMVSTFQLIAHPGAATTAYGLHALLDDAMSAVLATVAPVAGACLVAGIAVNLLTTGFHPSLHGLKPSLSKLNPINGAKNLFGSRVPFEAAKNIVKVAVVGLVAALTLIPQITGLGASVGVTPGALGTLISSSITGMVERCVAAYLLIGIVDFAWQRRRTENQLKMTKQEVKEEGKQYQLPPEVRSAIRRRMMATARARMMAAVPQADVVVTNPTHFAVALVYDGTKVAPEVVAKGQDLVAAQIRRIADEHDVPIVADPPLARALHGSVEIGELVPEELWGAVAQVLAFVYRVARRRRVGV